MKVEFDIPDGSDDSKLLNEIAEPSNRATLMTWKDRVAKLQVLIYRSGTSSVAVLEDDWITLYSGIVFKAFSPFFEIYNEILSLLESNGILGSWRIHNKYPTKPKVDAIGPQVLTMDHLWIGFFACLIPLALSALVFALEISSQFLLRSCSRILHKP